MFRLNTYLTHRGFNNITPNFGMGKVNAQWSKNNVLVKRHKEGSQLLVTIFKNGKIMDTYNINHTQFAKQNISALKNSINNL